MALRAGDWKYIPNDGKKKVGPELFNLKDDPAETKNLIGDKPDVAKDLAAALKKLRDGSVTRP